MGYVYFVSFFIRGATLSDDLRYRHFDNAEVALSELITSIAQIKEAEEHLSQRLRSSVKILFYQLLREDFDEEGKTEEAEAAITLPLFDQSRLVSLD